MDSQIMQRLPINRTGGRLAGTMLTAMRDSGGLPCKDASVPDPDADDMRRAAIAAAGPLGSLGDDTVEDGSEYLLDQLSARLAYERGGTRLYDAVLRKSRILAEQLGMRDCSSDLERIRAQEVEHAEMVMTLISDLGGDPTLETPCADLEGVMSSGMVQAVNDPRTSLTQCLHVAVVAELADVEAWTSLLMLSKDQLSDSQRDQLHQALTREKDHLAHVRQWHLASERSELGQRQAARLTDR
jgi:rubrerythrin